MDTPEIINNLSNKKLYKNLKPFLDRIAEGQQSAIQNSIEAIRRILSDKEVKVQHKLYAVRVIFPNNINQLLPIHLHHFQYLKDCFSKADNAFIALTQKNILPLLKTIALDSKSLESHKKYLNPKQVDVKNQQQMKTFKSELMSLYTLVLECLQNWADWIQHTGLVQSDGFIKAHQDLLRQNVAFPEQMKYFKDEEFTDFFDNVSKKVGSKSGSNLTPTPSKQAPAKQATSSKNNKSNNNLNDIAKQFQEQIRKILRQLQEIGNKHAFTKDQLKKEIESTNKIFEDTLDRYISVAPNFDENYVTHCYDQFDAVAKRLYSQHKEKMEAEKRQLSDDVGSMKTSGSKIPSAVVSLSKMNLNNQNKSLVQEKPAEKGKKTEAKEPSVVKLPSAPEPVKDKSTEPSVINMGATSSKITSGVVPEKPEKSHVPKEMTLENLPENVVFGADDSDEDSNQNNTRSIKSIPKTEIKPKKISSQLPMISEEKPQQNSELKINIFAAQTQNSNKKLEELEKTVAVLTKERERFQQEIESLKNHNTLEEQNKITKELMQLRREKGQLTEQIAQLQRRMQEESRLVGASNARKEPQANKIMNQPVAQETGSKFSRLGDQPVMTPSRDNNNNITSTLSQGNFIYTGRRVEDNFFRDEDQTHMHNLIMKEWVGTQENIDLFKLSIAGQADVFYAGRNIQIKQSPKVMEKGGSYFFSIELRFEWAKKSHNLGGAESGQVYTRYKNSSDTDLWTKPLNNSNPAYSTQVLLLKPEHAPFTLVRGVLERDGSTQKFILPFLFLSLLRKAEATLDRFRAVFQAEQQRILKSKIKKLNPSIICEPNYFQKYFQHALRSKDPSSGNSTYNLLFVYPPEQRVLMVVVELLSNMRVVFRVLELQGSNGAYGKELLDNLIFLFTI